MFLCPTLRLHFKSRNLCPLRNGDRTITKLILFNGQTHEPNPLSDKQRGPVVRMELGAGIDRESVAMSEFIKNCWNKAGVNLDGFLFSQITRNETMGFCDGKIMTYREFKSQHWREGRVWIACPSENNLAIAYRNRSFEKWAAFIRRLKL